MSDSPLPAGGAYETPDLHLASFLRCRGFTIVDLRRQDNRTVFLFRDSLEIRRAIVDYANDAVVGVRSFCNTLRDLKSLTRGRQSARQRGRERIVIANGESETREVLLP